MELNSQQNDIITSAQTENFIKVNAFAGTGKEQPLSEPILTPYGWVTMADLKTKSEVVGSNGRAINVTGIFPQGKKDVYQITFDDKSSTKCGLSHLWTINCNGKKSTVTTEFLLTNTIDKCTIDLPKPIELIDHPVLLLDPYLMGVLIGKCNLNGSVIELSISKDNIISKLEKHIPIIDKILEATDSPWNTYRIQNKTKGERSGTMLALEYYGLNDKSSKFRFIPADYLNSTVKDRELLFKALIDSMQYSEFSTYSKKLAKNITQLGRSIGKHVSWYKSATRSNKVVYRIRLLDCKYKTITDIEKVGNEECMCIKVDSLDELYITNGYTLTHNTTTLQILTETLHDNTFLYLVFGKAMADEAKKRFGENTSVSTVNSLAYRCVRDELDLKSIRTNYKVIELKTYYDVDYNVALLMIKIFEAFCNSAYKDINNTIIKTLIFENAETKLILKTKKPSLAKVTEGILNMWNDMYYKKIDMTHSFYLKYFHLGLDRLKEKLKYDYVLLDEANDTNSITLDVFNTLNGKKIVVGDSHQQIFSWRGTVNAMEMFSGKGKELYLSETFRFNNSIAKKANFLLSMVGETEKIISHFPDRVEPTKTKCHITRTNSGTIALFNKYHDEGKIVKTIRPPADIFKLPLSLFYFLSDRSGNKDKIQVKYLYSFRGRNDIKEYAEEANDIEMLTSLKIVEEYWDDLVDIYEQAVRNRKKKKVDVYLTTAHTCVAGDTLVDLECTSAEIINIPESGNIVTPENNISEYHSKVENPISDMIDITTSLNYNVKITPDHGMTIFQDGHHIRKNGHELQVGDLLRIKLGDERQIYSIPLDGNNLDGYHNEIKYDLPTTLDSNLAELLGLLVADGTITTSKFVITKRYESVIIRVQQLCNLLFNKHIDYIKFENKYVLECHSVYISKWLTNNFNGLLPKQKDVPQKIMDCGSIIQRSFMRGVFEDGTINVKHGIIDHISLSQTDHNFQVIKKVRHMLLKQGIISTYNNHKYNSEYNQQHYIYIYGQHALAFKNNIGFTSTEKQSILDNNDYRKKDCTNYIPFTNDECKLIGRQQFTTIYDYQNSLSRNTISRNVAYKLLQLEIPSEIKIVIKDRLNWLYVKIDNITEYQDKSYCVTVPNGNRFLQNGFDGFNCKGLEWDEIWLHDDFPNLMQRISTVASNMEEFRTLVEENDGMQGSPIQKVIEEFNLYYVALTRGLYKTHYTLPNSNIFHATDEELDILIQAEKENAAKKYEE